MSHEAKNQAPITPPRAVATPECSAWSAQSWRLALVAALLMLIALGWLLARLVWLYYFFGLFFYLVGGLLVGAVAFRIARAARPVEPGRLLRGVITVALLSSLCTIDYEFRHFASTVGQQPRFPKARNAAVKAGREAREIKDLADLAFRDYLKRDFQPGGPMGYVRWSFQPGEVELDVEGDRAKIVNDHRGYVWPARTLAGAGLLAAGLWFALESLRRAQPVTNILRPGEEILEEDA